MNTSYDKNIEAIAKNDADLALKLRASPKTDAPNNYRIADIAVFADELRARLKNPVILVFMGVSNLSAIIEYAKRPHAVLQYIVVVEKDLNSFNRALEQADYSVFLSHKNVQLMIGQDIKSIEVAIGKFFIAPGVASMTTCIDYCELPNRSPADDKYFNEVKAIIKRFVKSFMLFVRNDPVDAYHGFINALENWDLFKKMPLIDGLKGAMDGMPGVIVSTGPSLNNRIEQIKTIIDRSVVYSCNSALKILHAHNIKPHFVGAVERVKDVSCFYDGIESMEGVPLIVDPIVSNAELRAYPGPLLAMHRNQPIDQWFYRNINASEVGICSAHRGLLFLRYLGCRPIYFLGQDLAYERESGVAWADGRAWQMTSEAELFKPSETWIEGNDGRPIKTQIELSRVKDVLEDLATQLKVECISVMEESCGAKIKGFTRMDPAEFRLAPIEYSIRARIAESLERLQPAHIADDMLDNTAISLGRYSSVCDRLIENISKCALSESNLYRVDANNSAAFVLEQLEKAAEALQADDEGLHDLLLKGFVAKSTFDLSTMAFEIAGGDLDAETLTKRRFDIMSDWLSVLSFWARQLMMTIQRFQKTS